MESVLPSLGGGLLIGLAAALLLGLNGRLAGVGGIASGLFSDIHGDRLWRWFFLFGLLLGGLTLKWSLPESLEETPVLPWSRSIAAGFLVGFGAALSGGCTSGHGVCGLARRSRRSVVATLIFLAVGIATVFLTRHVLH